jgi:hypothetical protein
MDGGEIDGSERDRSGSVKLGESDVKSEMKVFEKTTNGDFLREAALPHNLELISQMLFQRGPWNPQNREQLGFGRRARKLLESLVSLLFSTRRGSNL